MTTGRRGKGQAKDPGSTPGFWSIATKQLLEGLGTTASGLTSDQAKLRFAELGSARLMQRSRGGLLALFLAQFRSAIVLILLGAAILSIFLRDPVDAVIILVIVLVSALLGCWQEYGAANVVRELLAAVRTGATVLRDGRPTEVLVEEVVPGDLVMLSAGSAVPADCAILESRDLYVEEAALTGETFPVEKAAGILLPDTPLARRTNALFLGTHVVSGTAKAVAVAIGRATEFGAISDRLRLRPPETDFERGVRHFGYLLAEVTLVLVIGIFAVNVYFTHPVLEALLFSLALAVGLTPQLLPAIISVNLAHGARRMAERKVIVKRLSAIENLGSMDVLCSDKTGTLSEGVVGLQGALDLEGQASDRVLRFAYLNAVYQSGFRNPIDTAIRNYQTLDVSDWEKLDEIPYDFVRRRLSVLVAQGETHWMVTKGALADVQAVCTGAEKPNRERIEMAAARQEIESRFRSLSAAGQRVLGVAIRNLGTPTRITHNDEADMTFVGFLVLFDPPKKSAREAVAELRRLGVALKIITGDNRLVAEAVGRQVGIAEPRILTGRELGQVSDEALRAQVSAADLFAEIEPNQKERIVLALKKSGHVVGFMGDGINDAAALHAADVGLSVQGAVDVAKEAADVVLLETDLAVIANGVREGRATFANTLKYVFMATSANFGNMFSMAGASLFLPFLPLLPKQILLTNVLTDLPEMAIATDTVDPDWIERPHRWDVKFIRNFMLVFGSVSSVFDYLTFGVLLFMLKATPQQFRTGWFMESVISATLIVLVMRSRGAFLRSRPGTTLVRATVAVVLATLVLPFTPLAGPLGFVPLPLVFFPALVLIVAAYVTTAELAKRAFYARAGT